MAEKVSSRIGHLASLVRDVWLATGLAIVLLGAGELLARATLSLRTKPPDPRVEADAYPREPWVRELYEENTRAARVRWEPYVYWRRLPFRGRYINIDGRGVRRTWRAREPGSGSPVRIFFFGGSSAWGTGVRDDFTIPSQLARLLEGAGVAVEVTNLGETGYVSTQEAIALLRELQRGNVPDLAVFYLGYNDTLSAFQNGSAGKALNEFHRADEFNLQAHARRLLPVALRALAARSALIRLAGLAPTPRLEVAPPPASPLLPQETMSALEANIRMLDGLSDRYGFRVNYFWEPCVFEKRRLTPWEARSALRIAYSREWLLATCALARSDWARQDAARFTYLGDLFADEAEPRFIDFVHPSEQGSAEIAAAIARVLLAHDRLAPPRR